MELVKVTGIVIRTIPYKEKDKLVTLFTLELGKIVLSAKGVMTMKSKLASCCNVHIVGNYELNVKNGFYTLVGCEIIDSFHDLSEKLDKFYSAEVFAEMTDNYIKEGQNYENFFFKLLNFYKTLVYENDDSKIILLKFLLELIAENGIELDFRPVCSQCGKSLKKLQFSYNRYSLICEECAYGLEKFVTLSESNRDTLCTVGYLTQDSLSGISIDNSQFREIMRMLYVILHNVLDFSCTAIVEYMKVL